MLEKRLNQVLISILFLSSLLPLVYSCTLSFNNVYTKGQASNIIDEDQTPDNNISPDISIPAI
jgi:hypothetical protein